MDILPPLFERSQKLTFPHPLDVAGHALEQLTEEQRLAFAHQIVSGARLRSSVLQLTSIETIARIASDELKLAAFVDEEIRKCL